MHPYFWTTGSGIDEYSKFLLLSIYFTEIWEYVRKDIMKKKLL